VRSKFRLHSEATEEGELGLTLALGFYESCDTAP
jgi:hypothetical protein